MTDIVRAANKLTSLWEDQGVFQRHSRCPLSYLSLMLCEGPRRTFMILHNGECTGLGAGDLAIVPLAAYLYNMTLGYSE